MEDGGRGREERPSAEGDDGRQDEELGVGVEGGVEGDGLEVEGEEEGLKGW